MNSVAQNIADELWGLHLELRSSAPFTSTWTHVWGLFFLKRLCDQFVSNSPKNPPLGDPTRKRATIICVPEEARWPSLHGNHAEMIDVLERSIGSIEAANPTLHGMFRWIDFHQFTNEQGLLAHAVARLSWVDLSDAALGDQHTIHEIANLFLERIADEEGRRGGNFFTPTEIVDLAIRLLNPKPRMTVSDPACGLGQFLIACADHVRSNIGRRNSDANARVIELHGQEKNTSTWAVCRSNLLIRGLDHTRIVLGDTIRNPRLVNEGRLEQYDRVVSSLPVSTKNWGYEIAHHDVHGRFGFGIPPRANGEYAFLQHIIATLKPDGIACAVITNGLLFRSGRDGEIRARIIRDDLFEAVIGLPPNLLQGTSVPAVVIVLNKNKAAHRRDKVLFVDASDYESSGRARSTLQEDVIQRVTDAYETFTETKNFCRIAGVNEIESNGYDLSVARYVRREVDALADSSESLLVSLRKIEAERDALASHMDQLLLRLR